MVKIDILLEPHLIMVMLDMVEAIIGSLEGGTMINAQILESDPELREAWESELKETVQHDCEFLLEVLQNSRFGSGELELEDEVAEGLLRACSAIRLKLREAVLRDIAQEHLETGAVDILVLPLDQQRCYACYLFLANLQSLVLHAIDPSCKEI